MIPLECFRFKAIRCSMVNVFCGQSSLTWIQNNLIKQSVPDGSFEVCLFFFGTPSLSGAPLDPQMKMELIVDLLIGGLSCTHCIECRTDLFITSKIKLNCS